MVAIEIAVDEHRVGDRDVPTGGLHLDAQRRTVVAPRIPRADTRSELVLTLEQPNPWPSIGDEIDEKIAGEQRVMIIVRMLMRGVEVNPPGLGDRNLRVREPIDVGRGVLGERSERDMGDVGGATPWRASWSMMNSPSSRDIDRSFTEEAVTSRVHRDVLIRAGVDERHHVTAANQRDLETEVVFDKPIRHPKYLRTGDLRPSDRKQINAVIHLHLPRERILFECSDNIEQTGHCQMVRRGLSACRVPAHRVT